MFRIRLLQNKEILIAIIFGAGLIVLIIFNGLILIPKMIEIYKKDSSATSKQLIDKEVVNQAIELLGR